MKKVIMVMSYFAPNSTSSSITNTKLTKYLARQDLDITLVTNALSPDMVLDPQLVPKEMDRIRVIRVANSKLYTKTFGRVRRQATDSGLKLKMKAEQRPFRALVIAVIKTVYYTCRIRDWAHCAKKAVSKQLKNEHFDILYSSYPSYQAQLLAKYVNKQNIADKWVADFRDPMAYYIYDKYSYKSDLKKQHDIERRADHITVVSEGAMDKFRFPDIPEEKITYIANGYDPEDFDIELRSAGTPDRLRLFYAGTLYAGQRDFTILFRAISELAAEGHIDLNRICVEYAGNEWPILQQFAEKYGMLGICVNYGYITRHRVMEIMGEIDCSIVCSNNTALDRGVVTGKVFELLLVGKPIIAVISGDLPDSELGAIIKDCSAGIVYEEACADTDYPRFKQWLLNVYREKIATGRIENTQNEERKRQYSYESIAEQLCSLFDEVLS